MEINNLNKKSVVPLAREFCSMVKEANLFKNIWCISDVIDDADKTTRIWGESKGSATAIDRIVILSDINPFEKFKTDGSFETLDYDFVLESTKYFISNKNNERNNTNTTRKPTNT
jgi:hypothetical protein